MTGLQSLPCVEGCSYVYVTSFAVVAAEIRSSSVDIPTGEGAARSIPGGGGEDFPICTAFTLALGPTQPLT
jgi:hypothetical protein